MWFECRQCLFARDLYTTVLYHPYSLQGSVVCIFEQEKLDVEFCQHDSSPRPVRRTQSQPLSSFQSPLFLERLVLRSDENSTYGVPFTVVYSLYFSIYSTETDLHCQDCVSTVSTDTKQLARMKLGCSDG